VDGGGSYSRLDSVGGEAPARSQSRPDRGYTVQQLAGRTGQLADGTPRRGRHHARRVHAHHEELAEGRQVLERAAVPSGGQGCPETAMPARLAAGGMEAA
jgi:hypothetical protein